MFSALWSDAASVTLRAAIPLLLSSLLGYHFACHYSARKQIQDLFLRVGAIAALTSCIFALLLHSSALTIRPTRAHGRGIFTHKNLCAFAMVLFISPLFGPRSVRHSSKDCLCLGGAYGPWMTQSRAGWVVCFTYIAAMCTLKGLGKFKRDDSRSLAVMGVLLLTAAAGLIYQNAAPILGLLGRDATLTGRTDIWQAVLDSIMRRPLLGYGYGAFWNGLQGESANVILACGWAVPHAHNGFLEVWLQLGLVGLSLLIATLVLAIRDFSVCFTPSRPRVVDWYVGLLLIVILYSFVEPLLLSERSVGWVLYVTACVGLRRSAIAARRLRRSSNIVVPQRSAMFDSREA